MVYFLPNKDEKTCLKEFLLAIPQTYCPYKTNQLTNNPQIQFFISKDQYLEFQFFFHHYQN